MDTDYKKLIEDATDHFDEQKLLELSVNSGEHIHAADFRIGFRKGFRRGASLPNSLLLKAINSLNRISYNNYRGIDQSVELRQIADETLSEIKQVLTEAANDRQ